MNRPINTLYLDDNPVKLNRQRPHHNIAKMLHERYVHEHALTSRHPLAANLPQEIITPAQITHDLTFLLDPPASHWSRSAEHELKRRHLRDNHNKVFKHVLENVKSLLQTLEYLGGMHVEDVKAQLHWLEDTLSAHQYDDAISYIEMPLWLLYYFDLLKLVQKYAAEPRYRQAEERFCLTLLYPHDDWSSYNLNLNYRWHLPDQANNLVHYNVLCGYRLGRSKMHRGMSGSRPAIYLEDEMKITTLFSHFGMSRVNFDRTGLISRILPEEYV